MGTKSRDWESIGNYVSRIEDEKLTYEEGAKRFGLDVSDIYEYNRRFKNDKPRSIGKVKNWKKIGDYASRIGEPGMKYTEGAKEFGLDVSEIYRYNRRQKEKKANASVERGSEAVSREEGGSSVPNPNPMGIKQNCRYRRYRPVISKRSFVRYTQSIA